MIELRGISFPGAGSGLLEDFNLELPDPGVYLLLGPGGSGKSLLARLLAGSLKPRTGQVLVDGSPLGRLIGGYRDPVLAAQAELSAPAGERLGYYLEAEAAGFGTPRALVEDMLKALGAAVPELTLRAEMAKLPHSHLLLAQLALAAYVPVRLAVLDGHLTYLDHSGVTAAGQLLERVAAEQDRFVVLTAARLAAGFPAGRRLLLRREETGRITAYTAAPEEILDTALAPVASGHGLSVRCEPEDLSRAQLASGSSFRILARLEDGYRVELVGSVEELLAEFAQHGIRVRSLEW